MAKICNKYWHCLYMPQQTTGGCSIAEICPHFQNCPSHNTSDVKSFNWDNANLDMTLFSSIQNSKNKGGD